MAAGRWRLRAARAEGLAPQRRREASCRKRGRLRAASGGGFAPRFGGFAPLTDLVQQCRFPVVPQEVLLYRRAQPKKQERAGMLREIPDPGGFRAFPGEPGPCGHGSLEELQ